MNFRAHIPCYVRDAPSNLLCSHNAQIITSLKMLSVAWTAAGASSQAGKCKARRGGLTEYP